MILPWHRHIEKNREFHTPEALLVRSNDGVGGLSRAFHAVYLEYLVQPPPRWCTEETPIILNTWEALYFHVNHDAVMTMARCAKQLGVNLICVDDGWFGKRYKKKVFEIVGSFEGRS